MKILFVAPRYHPNQQIWMKTLIERGHEVNFAALTKSENENYHILEPYVLPAKQLPVLLSLIVTLYGRLRRQQSRENRHVYVPLGTLRTYIRNTKPDVIIVRDTSTWLSLETFLLARLERIPTVLYTQQPLEDKKRFVTQLLQLCTIAPHIRITPTRKDATHEVNKQSDAWYVPLAVAQMDPKIDRTYCPNGTVRILFVGKFGLERKKHLLLLEAVNKLRDIVPLQVTLIGSYSGAHSNVYEEIEHYIISHNLKKIVTLKQNVPNAEMGLEYQHHDLFVLPSVGEPFAISPLEAMAHGLPVIVSDSGGVQYCITNGKNGYVVQGGSLTDLVSKLQNVIAHSHDISLMGACALQHIETEHSPDAFYRRLKPILERLS